MVIGDEPDVRDTMGDLRFRFWWLWLMLVMLAMVAIGYSAVVLLETPLWDWHQHATARALWATDAFPDEVFAYRRHAMGMLGPTIAAWAVTMCFVVAGPFRRRERWAWWCVLLSTFAWYPVDTLVSALEGVWVNVAFNTVALVLILLPLAFTHGRFSSHMTDPGEL